MKIFPALLSFCSVQRVSWTDASEPRVNTAFYGIEIKFKLDKMVHYRVNKMKKVAYLLCARGVSVRVCGLLFP